MRTNERLPLFIGAFAALVAGEEAPELCASCWCVPDDASSSSNGTCPEFGSGISGVFDPALVDLLESFVPAGTGAESFKLQSDKGEDCNPLYQYAGVPGMVRSDLPKCVDPDSAGQDVSCAMVFPDGELANEKSCCDRKYELVNIAEGSTTIDHPYVITHKGHCGVCSTAQDLAIAGGQTTKGDLTIDQHSAVCALAYHSNPAEDVDVKFTKLIECFEVDVGYSSQCAKLWAHYTAMASSQCFAECQPGPPNNEGPPFCELGACTGCTEAAAGENFYKFMGRTSWNSGHTSGIARKCADFTPNDHDYCEGSLPEAGVCAAGASVAATSFQVSTSAFFLSIGLIFLQLRM